MSGVSRPGRAEAGRGGGGEAGRKKEGPPVGQVTAAPEHLKVTPCRGCSSRSLSLTDRWEEREFPHYGDNGRSNGGLFFMRVNVC